ncbi:MAG TPA: NAD(P)-dependent oxidoreductase [Bacteroidia bacterium]|jgi:nucleoside-diphosphate-sugar epimerase|nr:NAD(P)-dependent oxidoreductase [Bacteroidia bacterium]
MKIIITGATGSLGRALTTHYAGKGNEVLATGRMKDPPKELLKYARYIQTDITKPFTLEDADVCIHAAARSGDTGSDADFYPANVEGVKNVLDAAKHIQTFIHVSSSSIYMPSDLPLKESSTGRPEINSLSPYGRSKLFSEDVIHERFSGNSCYILRPRALYGPGDLQILPRMLRIVKGGKLKKAGDMNIRISLTHYRNFAEAIDRCMELSAKGIHTYNVSDGKDYVLIDVVRKLTQALYGKQLEEKKTPIWLIQLLSKFNIGGITPLLVRSLTKNMMLDISAIRKETGYSPVTDLERSIPELASWVNSIGGVEVLKTEDHSLCWK